MRRTKHTPGAEYTGWSLALKACLLAAALLLPAATQAAKPVVEDNPEPPLLELRTGQLPDTRVKDDPRPYFRVLAGKPLGFLVVGPEALYLNLRPVIPDSLTGTGVAETPLMVFQDGFRIRTLKISGKAQSYFESERLGRPGGGSGLRVQVPEGRHAYRLELTSKDTEIVVSIARASEDLEAMSLVGLVDEGDNGASGDTKATKEGPVPWEESGASPPVAALPLPPVNLASSAPAKPAGPRRRHLLLGLRLLGAAGGVGTPALGGGVYALWRLAFAKDTLALGLSADLMPSRQAGLTAGSRPAMTTGSSLQLGVALRARSPAFGGMRWQAQLGAGLASVSLSGPQRSSSGFFPAASFSAGPSLALGPGAFNVELGATLAFGAPDDAAGTLIKSSTGVMSLGLLLGYQLTL